MSKFERIIKEHIFACIAVRTHTMTRNVTLQDSSLILLPTPWEITIQFPKFPFTCNFSKVCIIRKSGCIACQVQLPTNIQKLWLRRKIRAYIHYSYSKNICWNFTSIEPLLQLRTLLKMLIFSVFIDKLEWIL